MLELDHTNNGARIELPAGESLSLRLAENPTTGHRWRLRSPGEPACELTTERFEASGTVPGQGGSHVWQFRAVAPGRGTIELACQRSWEKQAAQEFKLTVSVKS